MVAYAAVDIALWDLIAPRKRASRCISCWAPGPTPCRCMAAAVAGAAAGDDRGRRVVQEPGVHPVRLQLGFPDPREDSPPGGPAQAVGDGFEIMVDVNQGWSVSWPGSLCRSSKALGITYLEEPLHCQDYKGGQRRGWPAPAISASARASACSPPARCSICCCAWGADMINPDLMGCGGVTEFCRCARWLGPSGCR